MTRLTRLGLTAAVALMLPLGAALAQDNGNASAPGTNSAGTAQSSGQTSTGQSEQASGSTAANGSAALGTGNAPPVTENGNAAVNTENKVIDAKTKSICRGC